MEEAIDSLESFLPLEFPKPPHSCAHHLLCPLPWIFSSLLSHLVWPYSFLRHISKHLQGIIHTPEVSEARGLP